MEVIVKDEDRRQLLKAHNDLRNMISTIHECRTFGCRILAS